VSIRQTFKLQFVPFYNARPALVTKLHLTHNNNPELDTTYAEVV
jgi:hypothetical protein